MSSRFLERTVHVNVYLPLSKIQLDWPVIYFNDGQDLLQMNVIATMQELISSGACPPFILIGIHANERRMQEYGTIQQADYAGRGNLASQYARFVTEELLPYLQQRYKLTTAANKTFLAGFSLGGLSAFDLAWHYPQYFAGAGVFSGALWWRSQAFSADDPDAHRILHEQVANAQQVPPVRFWFQTGTEDETDDRNNNGIIDSIDDTLDLISALNKQGYHPDDIAYFEMEGGQHEPATWAIALPHFLTWAVGK